MGYLAMYHLELRFIKSGIRGWGQEQHKDTSQEPGADVTEHDATTSTPAPATAAATHSLYIMKPGNPKGSPLEDTEVSSPIPQRYLRDMSFSKQERE